MQPLYALSRRLDSSTLRCFHPHRDADGLGPNGYSDGHPHGDSDVSGDSHTAEHRGCRQPCMSFATYALLCFAAPVVCSSGRCGRLRRPHCPARTASQRSVWPLAMPRCGRGFHGGSRAAGQWLRQPPGGSRRRRGPDEGPRGGLARGFLVSTAGAEGAELEPEPEGQKVGGLLLLAPLGPAKVP